MVRDAIDAIVLTGQAISNEGRQLTMADLDSLRALEKDYSAEATKEAAIAACPKRGRNRLIYVTPI